MSSSQGPLPDNNTQHSQQRDIYTPGGIRTHNPSRRAAVCLRFSPRGHWYRPESDNASSGICSEVDENCVVMNYVGQAVDYAAISGNFYRRFGTTYEDRKASESDNDSGSNHDQECFRESFI